MIRKSIYVLAGFALLASTARFNNQPTHLLKAFTDGSCPVYYGCPPTPVPNPGPDNDDKDDHHKGRRGGGKDDRAPHQLTSYRSALV